MFRFAQHDRRDWKLSQDRQSRTRVPQPRLPGKSGGGKVFASMKRIAIFCLALFLAVLATSAQTHTHEAAKSTDSSQLEALTKKIDEQNVKIDALSQEILKLEQQLSQSRPGVMIGEATPSSANSGAAAAAPSHAVATGNTHTVARGETLTSIAKMYKVTVDDLQKANHIEDGRKLQAGQTISIPTSATPTPTPGE